MPPEQQGRRLDSWKEIAEYLGRDLRTVMRWEQQRGLPVRRLPGGKRQSVFALTDELDAWLVQQESTALPSDAEEGIESPSPAQTARGRKTLIYAAAALFVVTLLFWTYLARSPREDPSYRTPAPPGEVRLEGPGFSLRFERTDLELGVTAYWLVAGDLNEDGIPDLVSTTAPGDVIAVLMGKGDGSFQPARIFEKCPHSDQLQLVDLNRDGRLDIVVACMLGDIVVVLWGRGDGTFPDRTEIPIPGGPRFVAAADVDGDGWQDLAVGAFGKADLFFVKNSKGKFHPAVLAHFLGIARPTFMDWDSDGKLDLVVGVQLDGKEGVGVLQGNGDGSFRRPVLHQVPERNGQHVVPSHVVPADLDHDGRVDLVVSTWGEDLMVLWGLGQGHYSAPQFLARGISAWYACVADLDGDGNLDILTTSPPQRMLLFFRNNGDRSFSASRELSVGAYPMAPFVADFNHDGLPDIGIRGGFDSSVIFKAKRKEGAGK